MNWQKLFYLDQTNISSEHLFYLCLILVDSLHSPSAQLFLDRAIPFVTINSMKINYTYMIVMKILTCTKNEIQGIDLNI